MNRRTRLASALLAASTLGLVPAGAFAQEPEPDPAATAQDPQFSVQPSGPNGPGGRDYFVYDLAPGETYGDTVGVSNLGDEPVRFAVYATDAFNAEGSAAFTLLKEEEEPSGVGTWVQLGVTDYTVPPGQRADIPFSITVPTDVEPGDHAGAIVAQPLVDSTTSDDAVSFDVRLRIGARLYVRVDGPTAPALRVDSLDVDYHQGIGPTSGAATVTYVVRNTGNLRLAPTGQVRIEAPFGRTVRELEARQLPELLPGGTFEVTETVRDLPLLGRLRAEVELVAPEASTRAGTSVWAVPWAVVALLAVVGLVLWRRHRRRRAAAAPPVPPARQREREAVPA